MQCRLLEQVVDVLQIALEVSMPLLNEDAAKEPVERQRSPEMDPSLNILRWLWVVTVPSWFDDNARSALEGAASDAGVKVLQLLDEAGR